MRLELRASLGLTVLTLAIHGIAIAIMWFFLPALPAAVAVVVLSALAVIALRERALLRAAAAPSVLELRDDGSLSVRLRAGHEISGVPAPRRYVSRWLVAFDIALPPRAHRTILVARDMLAPGEFRHLRLWALWNALPDPSAGGKV